MVVFLKVFKECLVNILKNDRWGEIPTSFLLAELDRRQVPSYANCTQYTNFSANLCAICLLLLSRNYAIIAIESEGSAMENSINDLTTLFFTYGGVILFTIFVRLVLDKFFK